MQNTSPKEKYIQQTELLTAAKTKLSQKKQRLSWLRFFSLLASFIALWQMWSVSIVIAIVVFVGLFGSFLFIVVQDLKNKEAIENIKLLLSINNKEIDILAHHFTDQPDGLELKPANHAYANDLDIFGKASVYQYINRTTSEQGHQLLAQWLLNPSDENTILKRQDAAKELTGNLEWRQQLQAYGITNPVTVNGENKITGWLKTSNRFIHNPFWKCCRYIYPLITITILVLYLIDLIPSSIFNLLLVIFLVTSYSVTKLTLKEYAQLNKIVPELETLQNSIGWIEGSPFNSELMKQLKNNFTSGSSKASASIRELKKILERLDYKLNPVIHIPLNSFFMWDLQQTFSLEKWKLNNQQNIAAWFAALAETEALATIATLSFNHPGWCFPVLSNDRGVFVAEELGHPLIPVEKRINNSFATTGEKQLNLITGSNMAGKSTFLRSVGVNIVLAMMGSPVCATSLKVSPVKVISTMRVNDNLEESTSTFYAELKKLKEIIEAVNKKEKVFLLLDEILRGTNSADRHTGSKALIKQLIHQEASGLIATHDLELAKLSDEFPSNLHNYHFDVQVQNEELYFDYKIKRGVCSSMNASLLMMKIGIDL
jgi:hypothetical protein